MAQNGTVRYSAARAPARAAGRVARVPVDILDDFGRQLFFYLRTLSWTYRVLLRYKKEVLRLIGETSFGAGALAVIGGTVVVTSFVTLFTGTEVALQGYQGLQQVGATAFAGFVGAYFDTRDIAPLVAAAGLTATVGAGFTAQLGAMRINEEIDALEVMAVPSVPFLVTSRIVAGLVAIIPIYTAALVAQYFATKAIIVYYFGQSAGTYEHYFTLFLPPVDVLYSYMKAIIFAVIIMLVCTYYGYHASGGPAGVGVAVGRAVRASLTITAVVDLLLTAAIWGTSGTVSLAG